MRKTNRICIGLCTGLLLGGATALAQPSETPPSQGERANTSDQEFLTRALRLNALELQLGKLASERGNSTDVKTMGQNMVQKHSAFGRQLNEQAQRQGVTAAPELTAEQQRTVAQLEKLSGTDFDKAFTATLDRIHQQELAMYRDEASRANDAQLRTLAQTRVETLQKAVNKQPAPPRPSGY